MVPMEEASCQVLRDAGRLNDASPPAAGESFYDCGHGDATAGGDSSAGAGDVTATTTTAAASSTTATETSTTAAASSTTAAAADFPALPAGGNSTATPEDPAQGTSEGGDSPAGSDQGTTGGTSGGEMGGTTGGTTGGTKSAEPEKDRRFIPMVCEKIDGVIGEWESLNCTMFKGADGGQWALSGN